MTSKVSLQELLDAGAHFGHQARRWNPKMTDYLYGVEDGVHVFDLVKTKAALEEALEFLKKSAAEGKTILLLGTKKQVQTKTIEVGVAAGIPYVSERWLGGTFSNFDQVKKSVKKLADMKASLAAGEYAKYTKKERLLLEREIARLERFFGGISQLTKLPDIMFVADTHKEIGAVKEAVNAKIVVVGIVDSNADPDLVDYPIPMNDDAVKALSYVLDLVKNAIIDGKKKDQEMTKIPVDQIRRLREQTGAPVIRVQKVLLEVKGNEVQAREILIKEGFAKVAKREGRVTAQGKLFTYLHHTGKVASVVELLCETDFVARNDLFETLGKDVALQVAGVGEKDLAKQEFIKDPTKKISDLVKEVIVKTGENIRIGRVFRIQLGQ